MVLTPPTISVIVVTYKRPEKLSLCLSSLRIQLYRPHEVIVTDDGDDLQDSHNLTLSNGYKWMTHSRTRKGGKEIRNEVLSINNAVEAATGDLIQIIQADHILAPDFLLWLARTQLAKSVLLGLTHHIDYDFTQQDLASLIRTIHLPDHEARWEKHSLQGRRFLLEFSEWFLIDGLNFAVYRDDWEPFDAAFVGHSHASMEWALRMLGKGVRFYLNPLMKLWHRDEVDVRSNLNKETQRQVRESMEYITWKYGDIWGKTFVPGYIDVGQRLRHLRELQGAVG